MVTSDEDEKPDVKVKSEVPDEKQDVEGFDLEWTIRRNPRKVSTFDEPDGIHAKKSEEGSCISSKAVCSAKESVVKRDGGKIQKMEVCSNRTGEPKQMDQKRRKKRSDMTGEELRIDREKEALRRQRQRERMTKEELEAKLEKKRLRQRERWAKKSEEERRLEVEKARGRRHEKGRKKWANLKEEEKQLKREKLALKAKEMRAMPRPEKNDEGLEDNEKLAEKLKKSEARKERTAFYNLSRRLNETAEEREQRKQKMYLNKCARMATLTQEEQEAKRQEINERQKERRRNHTPEERQIYLDRMKRCNMKREERFKAEGKLQQYKEKTHEYYQKLRVTETPEKRWKRLQIYKINQAVRKFRKQMKEEGISEDKIQLSVSALKMKVMSEPMPPPEKISKHKPRPRRNVGNTANRTGTGDGLKPQKCFLPDVVQVLLPMASEEPMETGKLVENSQKDIPLYERTSVTDMDGDSDVEDDIFAPAQSPPSPSRSSSTNQNDKSDDEPIEDDSLQEEPSQILQPIANPSSFLPHKEDALNIKEPLTTIPLPPNKDIEYSSISDRSSVLTPPRLQNLKCPKCKESMWSYKEFLEHYKSHQSTANANDGGTTATKASSVSAISSCATPLLIKHISKKVHAYKISVSTSSEAVITTPTKARLKPSFLCLKCPLKGRGEAGGTSFGTPDELRSHVKKAHPKFFWPCQHCKLLKYHKPSIEKHMEMCRKYFIGEGNCNN